MSFSGDPFTSTEARKHPGTDNFGGVSSQAGFTAMIRQTYLRKSLSVLSRWAALGALAAWLLSGGLSGWGGGVLMPRDGEARLISYQPLPEMQEGEDCLFLPDLAP